MSRPSWPALCGLLLMASATAVAAGGGGAIKPAATPEQAIANLTAAARAGDLDAFVAQYSAEGRKFMEVELKAARFREAFDKALADKFGKDEKSAPKGSVAEEFKKNFPRLEVKGKEAQGADKAVLTVWLHEKKFKFDGKEPKEDGERIVEEKWKAVKEGGSWKLLPRSGGGKRTDVKRKTADGKEIVVQIPELDPEREKFAVRRIEYTATVGPKFLAASEKVLKQVKDGAFKDREEARKALRSVQEALRKEFPPPEFKADEKKSPTDKK